MLHGESNGREAQAIRLAGLLPEASWFKSVAGLGALQLFEAHTTQEDYALQFQTESVVLVQRSREVQP